MPIDSVFFDHKTGLPENVKAFEDRRRRYRDQVERQTRGQLHRLGGGNG